MWCCQIFGLSKLLTRRGNGSQKGITKRGSGPQIFLPEEDLVIKYSYRKKIWSSNILTGRSGYQSDNKYSIDLMLFLAFITTWSM